MTGVRPLVILLTLLLSFLDSKAQAVFEVINPTENVGEVPYDSLQAKGIIYYTNTGDAPLYLTKAITFCPCTTAEISTEALAPGDTAQIVMTHYLKEIGYFEEAARIAYFDPNDESAAKYIHLSGTAVKSKKEDPDLKENQDLP